MEFPPKYRTWVCSVLFWFGFVAVLLAGCHSPAPRVALQFIDRAETSGLKYEWVANGKRPLTILGTIGNGCAFLDYDNDGSLDIFLIGSKFALFHGDGKGNFTDVSEATGLSRLSGYFLGCAVADYDNDGFQDIYISGYHTGLLLHNEAGKQFQDVTQKAGLSSQPWGSCSAFAETVPGSGQLDLFVGNYYRFENAPDIPQLCDINGTKTSCGPPSYKPLLGVFYKNQGDGTFKQANEDISISLSSGGALGAAFVPTATGKPPTLVIANDEQPTDLMVPNDSSGKVVYENWGMSAGIAVNSLGANYGGMGVDGADYDNDGQLDLFIVAFQNEINNLFHNTGKSLFENVSLSSGISPKRFSKMFVAFGCKFADFDNDGWQDLMVTNGHTRDNAEKFDETTTYRQPTQVFQNLGGNPARFEEVSTKVGRDVQRQIVGRGLAVGDYDNDGRVDALIVDSEGKPLLLHNESVGAGNSARIRLVGTKSNRDGIGALLIATVGGQKLTRLCHTDGSYFSASDKRVSFGLGRETKIDTLEVVWPSGKTDTFHDIKSGDVTLTEGGK